MKPPSPQDSLTLRNIGELVVVPPGPVGGRSMRQVRRISSAAVRIEKGLIVWFGKETELGMAAPDNVLDALGGGVIPGLIDCHTHCVFAGTREGEFVQRIQGTSYAEIARRGGGILVTVEAVRTASVDELVDLALPRLQRMHKNGVTTVEIKTGYGLSVEAECKILEAAVRLSAMQPIELVTTYLAAHATPREFAGRSDPYLDSILCPSFLQRVRGEYGVAFCDVFCEATAFDLIQSRRVLTTAATHGLRAKMHADQITQMGASRLAAEIGAVSADHLERIDDGGIAALKASGTIAVLLPGCSFFLGVEQAPARRMLESDLPVAVATDFNPGSSMIESLPLVLTMACTQMRMTPTEALVAATANAAAAIGRQDRVGAIHVGMQADLAILDVPTLDRWLYEPGRCAIRTVIKRGRVTHRVCED